MRWEGNEQSDNVEDRRGSGPGVPLVAGGGIGTIILVLVALYFGEGLEPEQIAERMHISVKTVYSKKHKIQSRLEAMLSQAQLAA